jgi:glutamate dehydrogenase (NAD(P)+)
LATSQISPYRHLGGRIDQATVAIEGFGSVGGWAARELAERGARIVAVADMRRHP